MSSKPKPKKAASPNPAAEDATHAMSRARTIVYVHGIFNKPPEPVLKRLWDEALYGFELGERSRMAYWVDRTRFPVPSSTDELDPDERTLLPTPGPGVRALAAGAKGSPQDAASAAFMKSVRAKLDKAAGQQPVRPPGGLGAKVLPLWESARTWITERVTKAWLEDVHDFLFVPARRESMRQSLISRLRTGGGPFVVIAHSQGSIIAYDVLSNWQNDPSLPPIDVKLFVTIGSPLGIQEVQDQLKTLTRQKKLATPPAVRRWLNFADKDDIVALDEKLASDYAANKANVKAEDFEVENPVKKNPHSGIGYLTRPALRDAVRDTVHSSLFQRVANFTIASNLVRELNESYGEEERVPVLIELQEEEPGRADYLLHPKGAPNKTTPFHSLSQSRDAVVEWILGRHRSSLKKNASRATIEMHDEETRLRLDLEALHSYVSANLTRDEVEELATSQRAISVYRLFRNAPKRHHLIESIHTVQAHTAHRGYRAQGQGITWAVLDTGIDDKHPHFKGGNIFQQWDCTPTGPLAAVVNKNARAEDRNGHGTHVAGIIAGSHSIGAFEISGIAPEARLVIYKVLGDDGGGTDAKIIKALDHIHATNERSGRLAIHGVNLSLGGPFDPDVFGCGDTPLCKQLRRLWRQGVVVVLAAGNEGFLYEINGAAVNLNVGMSIGDPANLDESVVVGSTHATKPHMYGVSHFSSRGPTADGRQKPDLVAPGEKILSCRAEGWREGKGEAALYTRMSGTSMAAPHVSGVIASFLSMRREFIGQPDRVKELLLASATDLERDRSHQGRGMVNLVKMLLQT